MGRGSARTLQEPVVAGVCLVNVLEKIVEGRGEKGGGGERVGKEREEEEGEREGEREKRYICETT